MPELPLCRVEWPGLNTYFDAHMTVGHGIYPGVCIITCPAQDNPIAAFGDLVWRAGKQVVRFPACRVDKLEMGLDPQRGRIWQITILDRRWRWQYNEVTGWYNVRLGNLSIRQDTIQSPQALAELCLEAMGETDYDTSEMPDQLRPEVNYDPGIPPAEALYQLCEMTACRIVPQFVKGSFTAVKIARMGQGEDLPPTTLEFNEGCDVAELPDKIGIRLGPTLIDVHLKLHAVISSDLFSNVQISPKSLFGENLKVASQFQRFPPPDPKALPTYDPERVPQPYMLWRELPPILRRIMQWQIGSWYWTPVPVLMPKAILPNVLGNHLCWTKQMQDKLREEALRCFQITLPIALPDGEEITSYDQFILEPQRAVTYEDARTGVISRAPAYVYGSYNLSDWGVNSEAIWDQLHNPVDPEKQLVYQGGMSVDPENKLVRFAEPMYRNVCPADNYTKVAPNIFTNAMQWSPEPFATVETVDPATGKPGLCMYYEPAALVLVTAIRLLNEDRSQARFQRTQDITQIGKKTPKGWKQPKKTEMLIDWSTHDDAQLRVEIKYKRSKKDYTTTWIEPVKTDKLNEKECQENADYYLTAQMQKYQTKRPQRARYPGLFGIQLDGAIEQVTYSSSSTEGAFTVACRHSEWAYGTLMPSDQRRQLKEVWTYRRAKEEQDQAKLDKLRAFIYVPSPSGGIFGRTAPGG